MPRQFVSNLEWSLDQDVFKPSCCHYVFARYSFICFSRQGVPSLFGGVCRPMPQAVENKCHQLRTCTTTSALFVKLCLDLDVLELCNRNMGDIRNDREDNRTRAFQKAANRQLWEKLIILLGVPLFQIISKLR